VSKMFKKINGVWTEQSIWSKIWKKTSSVWSQLYTAGFILFQGNVNGAYSAPYGISLTTAMSIDRNTYINTTSLIANYYNTTDGILYLKCCGETDANEDTGKPIKISVDNVITLSSAPIDLTNFTAVMFDVATQTYANASTTVSFGTAYVDIVRVSDGMIMCSYSMYDVVTRGVYGLGFSNYNFPCYIRVRTYGRGWGYGIEMLVYKVWLV
jgi:hypothetical protein